VKALLVFVVVHLSYLRQRTNTGFLS